MSKKKRHARQKIAKTLVSLLVLLIFIAPVFLCVKWAVGAVNERDPRKVSQTVSFKSRTLDNKTPLAPFQEPLVSLSFDDGWESVYTKAFPILQANGLRTTQFIISGSLDNYSYMSVAQLHAMQNAGTEIASHTITHPDLTTLDDAALKHELAGSKSQLSAEFGEIKDFTSPYGAYNAHTLQTIGNYYRSQKNAEGDPAASELEAINTKDSFKALNIKSYSVRQSTTLNDITKLLKAAQQNNGWLVLTYHQIDYSGEEFSVSPDVFKQQAKLVSSSKMRAPTMGQVLDKLVPKQAGQQ